MELCIYVAGFSETLDGCRCLRGRGQESHTGVFFPFFFFIYIYILVAVLLKLETVTQFYFSSDSYHSYRS